VQTAKGAKPVKVVNSSATKLNRSGTIVSKKALGIMSSYIGDMTRSQERHDSFI